MAYVNNEDQGSGLLGRVFTALGKGAPDIRRGTLIQDAELPYRNLFADYTSSLGPQKSGLDAFTKSYQSLTPQLSALDQLHSSVYGDLVKKSASYDPTANLRASGDYLFGNLDKYLKTGMDAGNAAMKQNLAAYGYGDRGPSGYSSLLNANRVTANLLPLVSGVINNLTPLSLRQNQDFFQNLGQIPAWMQGQTDALQATPYRELVPSQIQQGQLAGNLGLLNNLTQGEMANSYFYNQPNGWQKLGNVFSGLYGGIYDAADAANKVSSAYANVMSGGLGNLGGGKISGAEAPGSYPASTGLGTPEGPGEGTGENFPMQPTSAGYYPAGYGQPMPSAYPQLNSGYQMPGYSYGLSPYGLSSYGYSQNPYSQYGGFFA